MVVKMGHRGAKGYAPENTIESFKKAIDLGVDYIELDVHLTRDHHLVVHHDYKFGRTAFGCGKIRKMTVDEINQVRIKENDEPIPHLSEVLDQFRRQVKFNIEVKSKRGVEKLCRLIKSRKMQREVMISSNHVGVLLRMKKKIPEIETGLLHRAISNKFLAALFAFFSVLFFPFHRHVILYQAKRCKADCVHPAFHLATKSFVKKMQDKGYKVNVWGARSRYVLKLLKKRNVDGIITDYPDRI